MRYYIVAAAAAFILALSATASAEGLTQCSSWSVKSKQVSELQVASLQKDGGVDGSALMSPRQDGKFAPTIVDRLDEQPSIQLAGRCGSSNYYCDETGATYCCGNSTDGFYCAKDVNGC
jgi:hypothetical protein